MEQWTRLILTVRIPWTNLSGDLEQLANLLKQMPRLRKLLFHVISVDKRPLKAGPKPTTRASTCKHVLQVLRQGSLQQSQFRIHVHLPLQQTTSTISTSQLEDYDIRQGNVPLQSNGTQLQVLSPVYNDYEEAVQAIKTHLLQIYSIYRKGWRRFRIALSSDDLC